MADKVAKLLYTNNLLVFLGGIFGCGGGSQKKNLETCWEKNKLHDLDSNGHFISIFGGFL